MVCVTQQKTCDRLMKYGHDLTDENGGELFIIHVAPADNKLLDGSEDGEALDYLYDKAIEYGANLTVVRSDNIMRTLLDLVDKHSIKQVVMGETGNVKNRERLITEFEKKVSEKADVFIVPAEKKN